MKKEDKMLYLIIGTLALVLILGARELKEIFYPAWRSVGGEQLLKPDI